MKRKTVYLSGGFKSGWQNIVKQKLVCDFFDPREHGISDPAEFTKWDLDAIVKSDIIFAYLESSNTRPYGLVLELGYAKALNKYIILVDEKSHINEESRQSFIMANQVADVVTDNIEEGLGYLKEKLENNL